MRRGAFQIDNDESRLARGVVDFVSQRRLSRATDDGQLFRATGFATPAGNGLVGIGVAPWSPRTTPRCDRGWRRRSGLVLAAIPVGQRSGPAKKAADQAPYRVPLAIRPPKRERLVASHDGPAGGLDAVRSTFAVRKCRLSDGTSVPRSHGFVSRSAKTRENPAVTNPSRPNRRRPVMPA